MATKDLFIHAIQQVEVDGSRNIPTALYYTAPDDFLLGYEALTATRDLLDINQDFKVDLGRHDSQSPKRNQTFRTAIGENRSAYIMTSDFIGRVLRTVSRWLQVQQVEEAAHVLIAEPLAMHEGADPRWLENYRRNLREMLEARSIAELPNIRFQDVSFLPEPFAVFQYYRYGIKHPLMAESAKHQALILDFGGAISGPEDYEDLFLHNAAETSIELFSNGEGQLVYLVMMVGSLIITFSHDAKFQNAQAMPG